MSTYLPGAMFPLRLNPSILYPPVGPILDVYAGTTPETIDYTTPITSGVIHNGSAHLDRLALPAPACWLALRYTSQAGIAEHNTHRLIAVNLSEEGELLRPPLHSATGLHLIERNENLAELWFSCPTEPGGTPPSGFEILIDDQAGAICPEPLAVLEDIAPAEMAFRVELTIPHRPGKLFVRALHGDQRGPVSPPVTIQATTVPATPEELTAP